MTDDSLDAIKNILGEEAYAELENMGKSKMPLIQQLISNSKNENIAENVYAFPISFYGQTAFDLMSDLIHAAEENCQDCEASVMKFAGSMIGAMWVAMLEEEEMLTQEGNFGDPV